MKCKPRCERFTIAPCDLEGFDLLVCTECGRPVGAKVRAKYRPGPYRPKRGDLARARRARRRRELA